MHLRLFAAAGASVAATVLTLSGLVSPAAANAATGPSATAVPAAPGVLPSAASGPSAAKPAMALPSGAARECPPPSRMLQVQCFMIVKSKKAAAGTVSSAAVTAPYTPADLQGAYGLTQASATAGTGETVAVVDAFGYPNAAADLAQYRSNMSLPACDTSTGAGCVSVFNQNGAASPLPSATDPGWENETALDLDMVSAICPNCHIDLFEANSDTLPSLGAAENAAAKAAKFVSNSWGMNFDYPGESSFDQAYFNHPGVAVTFASGDYGFGYGADYPASSPLVTSVGGTYLDQDSSGNWTEQVWNDQLGATVAGCSSGEAKPSWQTDTGCANRTQNDVAAVASGPFGVGYYTSVNNGACTGACSAWGTSVAAPIIAATYALAGTPTPNTYPVSYLYQNSSGLHHITSTYQGGPAYGTCESNRLYLCNAADSLSNGYNGPTGFGTPNGTAAFTDTATGNVVSVVPPSGYALLAGAHYALPAIKAYDSASGQTLTYSATGLPAGLSLNTSTGAISGAAINAGNAVVHVTVRDGTGASATVSFRITAVKSLTGSYRAGIGPVRLDLGGMCLNDAGNSGANGAPVGVWKCNGSASENWLYQPSAAPGGAGTVRIHGKCLNVYKAGTANGSKLNLYTCNGHANQAWVITGALGELYNPVSGRCINDPRGSTSNGTQLVIWDCNYTARQAWTLPASPFTSGVGGKCVNDAANSGNNGTKIVSWACDGYPQQKFTIGLDGSIRIHGKCAEVNFQRSTNGSPLVLYNCAGLSTPTQFWVLTAYGTIENLNSEKCLAVPANSAANGPQLVIQDCSMQSGEIWAVS